MNNKHNFTIKFLESLLCPPTKNRVYIYDAKISGLGIAVTRADTKSFFVYRKINGVPKRITLGRFPDMTIEQARNKALEVIRKVADGIDPVAEKREKRARSVTLEEVFHDYLKTRKNLKQLTITDYTKIMREAFLDWQNKSLRDITKDMIAKRHSQLGERSKARANNAMRVLRALFNFAAGEYEDANGQSLFLENPVKRLSHTRAWYKIAPKKSVIKMHELKPWFNAVMQLAEDTDSCKSGTVRDYVLLLLFTGLRRQEAAALTWDRVDLTGKTLTIDETKNHEQHVLPLSNFIFDLLSSRTINKTSNFVFPGQSKAGHLVEPRKQMDKIIVNSGVKFTLHDLRRTFITIAESLDISNYTLKKLLNHKMPNDITAGYIIINIDRLREPMTLIERYILDTVK